MQHGMLELPASKGPGSLLVILIRSNMHAPFIHFNSHLPLERAHSIFAKSNAAQAGHTLLKLNLILTRGA